MAKYINCGTEDINCISSDGLLGEGEPGSKILFLSDNISEEDYKLGRINSKKSRELIKVLLEANGMSIDDCYFTAVVKSPMPSTDKGQLDPTPKDIKAWTDIAHSEIELIDPDIIVPLGNAALKLTYNRTGITKFRGNAIEVEYGGRKRVILPIVHPEMVFRQPKHSDSFISDFKSLGTVVKEGFKYLESSEVEYKYLETVEEVKDELGRMMSSEWICFDIETTGLNPFRDTSKIGCISFTDRTHYGVTVPIEHPGFTWGEGELDQVIEIVRQLLENPNVKKMGHNVKFDMLWELVIHGIDVKSVEFDPQIAHYLAFNQDKGTHGLKALAWEFTDMGGYDNPLDDYKKEHGIVGNYNLIPWEIIREYAAADVDCTFRLFERFKPEIDKNPKFVKLMEQYSEANYAIRNMEYHGAMLDVDKLNTFREVYDKEIEMMEEKLKSYPEVLEIEREKAELFRLRQLEMKKPKEERDPEVLKWNKYKNWKFSFKSVQQLRELLFDKLGLTTPFKTEKGELSTGAESIDYMREQHPIVNLLSRYRKIEKLRGTYIEPAAEWYDMKHIVHPTFNLTGCVAPGTRIKTNKGYIPLHKIIDCSNTDNPGELRAIIDKEVEVFDGEVYRKPLAGYFSGYTELVMIEVNNREKSMILCTLNHRLGTSRGWVRAESISRFDKLLIFNQKQNAYEEVEVSSVKDYHGPAFDLVMNEYEVDSYESDLIELNDGTTLGDENPENIVYT